MSEKHRSGSMGAAEAKSTKRFFIGASVIVTLIFLITVLPIDTYFHAYFKRAALTSKIAGIIVFIAWNIYLWIFSYDFSYGKKSSAGLNIAILVIGLILMLGLLFGFNLDLHGLE